MINVINDHKSLLKLEKVTKDLKEIAKKVLQNRMSPSAPFHWSKKKKLAFKLEKELLQQLLLLLDGPQVIKEEDLIAQGIPQEIVNQILAALDLGKKADSIVN